MEDLARMLILLGVLLAIIGGAMLLLSRIPGLGRLPGDISIQLGGVSCFFPIVTSIVLSILLTILLNVLSRLMTK